MGQNEKKLDNKQLMRTAVLAGEIMLKSGAETYRVEDTMAYILNKSGAEHVDPVAYNTAILVTLQEKDQKPLTIVRRVRSRGINLNNIVGVNEISRKFCTDEMTLDETYGQLRQLKGRQYSRLVYNLGTIGVVLGFALFLGGKTSEAVAALIVGVVEALLTTFAKKLKVNDLFLNVICGSSIALSSVLLQSVIINLNMDTIIISAIMPLVPGVAITNAVRDTLQGDTLSGAAGILEAFLIAAAIAIGVGAGMTAGRWMIGGI